MKRMLSACLMLACGLVLAASSSTTPLLPNASPHQSVGTVNCASSTCHGAVAPWTGSNVQQDEYTTWLRLDKHAKAYAILLNAQSRSIAAKLGLKQGAENAQECLDCHAHTPPPAQRGERHMVTDGVGCEACHGPADKWIRSHTAPGATHADNVAKGMYPTEKPVEQAKLCLSCHVGDSSRFVSHRLMGAGHPRLSFELDTFAQLAPAHYKVDDDWRKRKGDYDSVRLWAIGQALASKNQLDALTDPKRGRDGLFPELALFDCHSCHHPMSEKKWTPRLGVGPGRMRLNDSNLLMLRAIVRATDPSGANAFSDQVAKLHLAVSGNPGDAGRGADPLVLAAGLSASIQRYIGKLEQQRFTPALQRAVLAGLIDEAKRQQFSDYAGAEQAYMAISSVSSALAREGALGGPAGAAEMNRKLTALRASLANEDAFKPDVFAQGLQGLSRTISLQAN
ncbi:multiheme c-type cytochrome [Duganella sp. BuS-21]|uniref:multiheme c-type cytochrome n=1 Tax=Duganella sp. BuS-21 TaxID=2943848 RepID=UPI0035A5F12B